MKKCEKLTNGCSVCAWLLTSGACRRQPSAHTTKLNKTDRSNNPYRLNKDTEERAFALSRLQIARSFSPLLLCVHSVQCVMKACVGKYAIKFMSQQCRKQVTK